MIGVLKQYNTQITFVVIIFHVLTHSSQNLNYALTHNVESKQVSFLGFRTVTVHSTVLTVPVLSYRLQPPKNRRAAVAITVDGWKPRSIIMASPDTITTEESCLEHSMANDNINGVRSNDGDSC